MPIRQFHLLRAYAEWGRVKLVVFYRNQDQLEATRALAEYCESVHPVSVAQTYGQTVLGLLPRWHRRLRLTCARRPSAMTRGYSPEMARIIEELATSADLVHVARLHMVPQVERLLAHRSDRPRFVLDLADIETSWFARRLRFTSLVQWPSLVLGLYELVRLWRYQAAAARWFDRVLVCSDRERDRLRSGNVIVVPHGTKVPSELPRSETDGRTLLFCGWLSYPPNADALEFFVARVLPLIRKEVPDVRLLIVGHAPTPRIRALPDGEGIQVAADVPSVAEYYRKATVAVVPLRFGSGTRMKILEAWALGVPVVSTSLGCEGLDVSDGEQLALADTPGQFARACVALLRAPALRRRLVQRGRELVWRKHRWEVIGAEVVGMAREVLVTEPEEALDRLWRMVVGA